MHPESRSKALGSITVAGLALLWIAAWLLPRYSPTAASIVESRRLAYVSFGLLIIAPALLAFFGVRSLLSIRSGYSRLLLAVLGILALTPMSIICGFQVLTREAAVQPAFLSIWVKQYRAPWESQSRIHPAYVPPPPAPVQRAKVDASLKRGMTRQEVYSFLGPPMDTLPFGLPFRTKIWYLDDGTELRTRFLGSDQAGPRQHDRPCRQGRDLQAGEDSEGSIS
jgi:hypothetical protein